MLLRTVASGSPGGEDGGDADVARQNEQPLHNSRPPALTESHERRSPGVAEHLDLHNGAGPDGLATAGEGDAGGGDAVAADGERQKAQPLQISLPPPFTASHASSFLVHDPLHLGACCILTGSTR